MSDTNHIPALMISELRHRLANSMTVMFALVRELIRTSPDILTLKDRFDERAAALLRAQQFLLGESSNTQSVKNVVELQLGSDLEAHRIDAAGPHVQIGSEDAFRLSIVLYELATNSRKHGSLGYEDGFVHVDWHVDAERAEYRLSVIWTETGGPTVTVPQYQGIGTKLIRQLFDGAGRSVEFDFAKSGVCCKIGIQLPAESG
jgi:two-component system CheB/CheR fusion protein